MDPKDDLYIECALAAGAMMLVSDDHDFRDPALRAFGIEVRTAVEFETEWRERNETR